jgi:4-amino-4-deoxy-L-arabinose transferase-like glycosyltransferase
VTATPFTTASWAQYPKLILVVATLAPRILLLIVSLHHGTPFGDPAHDGYVQIAQNFVQTGLLGLDSHHLLTRGPLFSLLLAPGVVLGRVRLWSAVLQLAASVATTLLVFFAVKNITSSVRASFWGALAVAWNPWLIWFIKIPMTTVTATFFSSLATYFFVLWLIGRRALASSLAMGAACGLAALDHPALIAMAGGFTLAILVVFLSSRKSPSPLSARRVLVSVAAMWAAVSLTLLPNVIRNYRESGRPVLVSDGVGVSYFMGAVRYALSPYPWANVDWEFDDLATRLHVSVQDLEVEYFTINDRFNQPLATQARQDLTFLILHRPVYLAQRATVMAVWFLVGDFGRVRTLAHCVFLFVLLGGSWLSWRSGRRAITASFLVIIVPGLLLHAFTMSLIGHAAYSIPYLPPLAMPFALAMARQPVIESASLEAPQASGGSYAFE